MVSRGPADDWAGNATRLTTAFEGQQRILAMLAAGAPVEETLTALCHWAEALEPGAIPGILILDRDGRRFESAVAPRLGANYTATLAGLPIGPPHIGTCAAAVFNGIPVTSVDIAEDPRWDPMWRTLHLDHGVRACQSTPIIATDGSVLGSFVLGFAEPRDPDAWDAATIALSLQLAGLALERARAMQDLAERVEAGERHIDRLWALSEDLLVVARYDGPRIRVSASWTRLLGHDEATLLSAPAVGLVHPDDVAAVTAFLERMRRDGRRGRVENRMRAADGTWYVVAWTAVPDPDGETYHAVGRDVTAERAAADALRRTEAQLHQVQKMETVGQLTAGVAHDFNNILASVIGNLELVEMDLADETLRALVHDAALSAQRGAALTKQLLTFARKSYLTALPLDVGYALARIADLLLRTLGGTVEIRTIVPPGTWRALVDATQFEMAVMNLAINARDAMGGGVIRIEARNVPADAPDRPASLPPGLFVAVSVNDTGTGMSPETLDKAFEPFFTTKERGKGTGLGLSQVFGFAKQSGGDVRISSRVGVGTTVELFLPRASALAIAGASPADRPTAAEPGRATVMVIDDQDDVRAMSAAFLKRLGHAAIPAASGRVALDLLADPAARDVEVLLLDYAMPGLSGAEVAHAARAQRPDIAIVLVTGYADSGAIGDLVQHAVLLRKPFKLKELAAAIDAAILARPASGN